MRNSRKPSVLLTGATGQVGVLALPRLLAAGHPVVALSRRIAPGSSWVIENGNLRWVHPDSARGIDGMLQGIRLMLSCGPVAAAVRLLPYCPQLQRVVCMSTSSVYTKQTSPSSAERQLIAGIRLSENELDRYCESCGVSFVLLRPTLIYGCGLDENISRIARLARRLHFVPVAGEASGLRQPVHADDLAELAVRMLEHGELPARESPVGGGSVLSYREMVERVFTGIGLVPHIVRLPPAFLATLVRAISWLPSMGGLNAQFIFRQNEDLVFDDSWLRDRLAYNPRPFAPTKEDFIVPKAAAALQPL